LVHVHQLIRQADPDRRDAKPEDRKRCSDADRASVLLECSARDLLAAAWLVRPADHTRPEGWLGDSRAMRG